MKILATAFAILLVFTAWLFMAWTHELVNNTDMKKVKGYIPAEPSQDFIKHPDHVKIGDKWYVEAEVWIPGVNDEMTDLHRSTHFRAMASGQRCANCSMTKDRHKGPNLMCPAKDEKQMPGRKYD